MIAEGYMWLSPTLDFSSGRDLRVVGSGPASGSPLSTESACPRPSALPPLVCVHALSLSLSNKYIHKIFFKNHNQLRPLLVLTDTEALQRFSSISQRPTVHTQICPFLKERQV